MNAERERVLILQAVRRYRSRCFWISKADEQDLAQEAQETILHAKRTFSPDVGVPLAAYCWRAVMLTLRRWALKNSSPVSASAGELYRLAGLFRAPLEELSNAAYPDDRESTLDAIRLAQLVHHRIHTVENGHLAFAVLLRGERSRDVARAERVPVRHVYDAGIAAHNAIWNDCAIWRLWRERNGATL